MNEELVQNKVDARINIGWLFQLIASLAWVMSVFVYGSYELGDFLQLTAASAWTVSNIVQYFTDKKIL